MELRSGQQGMLSYLIYKWGWWRTGLCTNPKFCSNQVPKFKQINWGNNDSSGLFLRSCMWQFYPQPPKHHHNRYTGATMWTNRAGWHKQAHESHGPQALSRSARRPSASPPYRDPSERGAPRSPRARAPGFSVFGHLHGTLLWVLLLYATWVCASNIGPYAVSLFI